MITRTKKMESFSGSKSLYGSILADISHDLKSFLNPIIGFSSVLLQDDQRLKADQLKHISVIYESAKKLLERIDALVLLLRLQQQPPPPNNVQVDVVHLLQEQVDTLRELATAKNIRLQLEASQPIRLQTNSHLLMRGLRELMEYSLERLGCEEIRIQCRLEQASPRPQAVVEIHCPGMRISAKEAESWQLFLRASDDSPLEIKGIGLWLALARACINSAGGQLDFLPPKGWEIRLPS